MGEGGAGEEGGYLDGHDPGEAGDKECGRGSMVTFSGYSKPQKLAPSSISGFGLSCLCTVPIILSICGNKQGLAKVAIKLCP